MVEQAEESERTERQLKFNQAGSGGLGFMQQQDNSSETISHFSTTDMPVVEKKGRRANVKEATGEAVETEAVRNLLASKDNKAFVRQYKWVLNRLQLPHEVPGFESISVDDD